MTIHSYTQLTSCLQLCTRKTIESLHAQKSAKRKLKKNNHVWMYFMYPKLKTVALYTTSLQHQKGVLIIGRVFFFHFRAQTGSHFSPGSVAADPYPPCQRAPSASRCRPRRKVCCGKKYSHFQYQ
jgi:hypothetical protein